MSSIISLLPFDLYKLYSIAVEVYYALRAFALQNVGTLPHVPRGHGRRAQRRRRTLILTRSLSKFSHFVHSAQADSFRNPSLFLRDWSLKKRFISEVRGTRP